MAAMMQKVRNALYTLRSYVRLQRSTAIPYDTFSCDSFISR